MLAKDKIAEAIERYPIGTKVKSLFIGNHCKIIKHNYDKFSYLGPTKDIWFTGECGGIQVYKDGKWAESDYIQTDELFKNLSKLEDKLNGKI